jgi:nicotinic acid mononucleotide adenylyltransferase
MAFEFQHRTGGSLNGRVAIFPGAYNPPTIAHLAMARAARTWAGEVIWTLPRTFPHKGFEGACFDDRVEMLRLIAASEPGFSAAVSDGGLYLEIADEARAFFARETGREMEIALVCGRDAAERIAAWDYGRPGVFDQMIERYPLLVAGRAGDYLPAAHHAGRIVALDPGASFDEVSSTEVRRRIESGTGWRDLVPDVIADMVARIY